MPIICQYIFSFIYISYKERPKHLIESTSIRYFGHAVNDF